MSPGGGRLAALTGATGFVGPHVAAALDAAGWRLRILVRRHPLGLPGLAAPVEVVPGELADAAALERLCDGAAVVVHLAGAIKARDAAGFHRANAEGSVRVADAWRRAAPEAGLVHLSSLAARAPGLSAYAASKRAGEERLRARAAADGAGVTVLRPAAVYGPGDRETLALFRAAQLPLQPLLNGPGARLCVIHARDVAAAVAAAAAAGCPDAVWELSDARREGYAWAEIAAAAAAALGRRARPIRIPAAAVKALGAAGDFAHRLGAGTAMIGRGKVREILHPDWASSAAAQPPPTLWSPAVPIASGFAETVRWYREQGWLA